MGSILMLYLKPTKLVQQVRREAELQLADAEKRHRAELAVEQVACAERELVQQVRREAELQLADAEKRHRAELAVEQERVREAHEMVELVQQRANKDVMDARAREEARIAQIRAQAEHRARDLERRMREEATMRDQHVIERQRMMEEALYAHGREKEYAIESAQRHLAAMEQDDERSGRCMLKRRNA
eukprot:g2764.t4